MRQIPPKFLLLVLVALGVTPATVHGAPVWPLLSEVRVAGDAVYLSDLLPAQASAAFRSMAARIRLSAAPPPGSSMILTADKVEEKIPGATRREVLLPSEIVVRRLPRLLTREEVIGAMNAALQSNSFPGNPRVDPDAVQFSAEVRISGDDPHLRVRRVDFDAALQQARFLMVPGNDTRALPFLVTARLTNNQQSEGGRSKDSAGMSLVSTKGEPAGQLLRKSSDAVIASGQTARLQVLSSSMQMLLDVVALEPGALHQVIRVRVPGSSRVLRGEVIAPGRLEARF
ncbi:MAG TPA: flagella basal body P-ring formation protein FlgA [Candidatus Acidoferrales bacterium]|nr:flagella basal body P-ring formation protein FlgA [Candidatus Acidoferrales bacterium]